MRPVCVEAACSARAKNALRMPERALVAAVSGRLVKA